MNALSIYEINPRSEVWRTARKIREDNDAKLAARTRTNNKVLNPDPHIREYSRSELVAAICGR